MDILTDVLLAKSEEMEAKLEQVTAESQPATFRAVKPSSDSLKDNSELELGAVSLPTELDLPGKRKKKPIYYEDPAIVEGDQPPGKMSVAFVDSALPGHERWGTTEITYSFSKGSLHGVHYKSKEFKAYLPGPVLASGLEEAFNEGQVFKLQYKAGERTGEIVWGDIPHKTNKTGGPEKYFPSVS